MRVVHHLTDVYSRQQTSVQRSHVTIGVFDGLHRGHQKIITGLVKAAHGAGRHAIVITFDPHPVAVLTDRVPLLLTTVGERLDLMESLGVDTVIVLPFTEETVHTKADEFLVDLMRNLHLAEIRVGRDFTLGYDQEGNVAHLKTMGVKMGFRVCVVDPVEWDGSVVHSSRIRSALRNGDVEEANGCLGRPYRLSGVVIRGRGLGQDIGVPTANIAPPHHRLVPGGGVYACRAHTERWGSYPAAANVGTRPTFSSQPNGQNLTVEAHLLDFDRDLYDQVLSLDFIARLRDERAYPTLNALVAQMEKDIARTQALVSS